MEFKRKRIKQVVGMALAFAMMFSLASVSASDGMSKDERAIAEKVAKSVTATMSNENGEVVDVEILDIEVNEVPLPAQYKGRASGARAYETKVKTGKSSINKNSISANAVMTMTWIDGPWTENEIVNLKGYWKVSKGTFEYGRIFWGGDDGSGGNSAGETTVGQEFNEDIGYVTDSGYGQLSSQSQGHFTNASGEFETLILNVDPTIFD